MKKTIIDANKLTAAILAKYPSERQFCLATGFNHVTLSRLKNGMPWTSRVLDNIANALGVSSIGLLREVEVMELPLEDAAPDGDALPVAA